MYDFIISGAGLTGVLITKVLRKFGYSVFLFDNVKSIQFDSRISAISYGSKLILEKFGLWDALQPFSSPMFDIYTSSSSQSLFYLHFSSDEFISNNLISEIYSSNSSSNKFPLAYTVPNFALQKVLYEDTKIDFSLSYESVTNSLNGVSVIFNEIGQIDGKIFICAEGKNSRLRTKFCIPTYNKKYLQYAIVASVNHKREHHNTAQEIFYNTPFALLPLKNPNQSSLIFTINSDFAHLIFKLKNDEFIKILNKKCNLEIDDIIGDKHMFPLSLSFALKYFSGRTLFMGDSIHSIHPVAGQGFNLTIYDLDSFINSINSFDICSERYKYVFSKFYCDRFYANLKMAFFTDSIIKLFSINNTAFSFIRNFALSMINDNNAIKDFFIRKAIGYEK